MTIRPIDMQISIQKSDYYTRESNLNRQTNDIQQGLSMETQKETMQNQRQVTATEASDNSRIDRDGGNESKGRGEQRKGSKKKRLGDENSNIRLIEDDKGAFVDLSI